MGFLAGVGIVSTAAVALAVVVLFVRVTAGMLKVRKATVKPQAKESALPAVRLPMSLTVRASSGANRWVTTFYKRYSKLYDKLQVPEDAYTVTKCSCIFSLEHERLEHYAWLDGQELYFFPKWESVALMIGEPTRLHIFGERDVATLFGWKIPIRSLEYFRINPIFGDTAVYYTDSRGVKYKTLFLEGGSDFFRAIVPGRDYALMERREYLGSYKNIRDLREVLLELAEKVNSGEISHADYEREKLHIIKRM